MICKIDQTGRLVIPNKIRRQFGIKAFEPLEMTASKEGIVISKVKKRCALCDGEEQLKRIGEKHICLDCLSKIAPHCSNSER